MSRIWIGVSLRSLEVDGKGEKDELMVDDRPNELVGLYASSISENISCNSSEQPTCIAVGVCWLVGWNVQYNATNSIVEIIFLSE